MALAQKQEIAEKTIVEALAEDVAVHGWKVTSYRVTQDLEKEERSLSISLHRSTGDAQQKEMELKGSRPKVVKEEE